MESFWKKTGRAIAIERVLDPSFGPWYLVFIYVNIWRHYYLGHLPFRDKSETLWINYTKSWKAYFPNVEFSPHESRLKCIRNQPNHLIKIMGIVSPTKTQWHRVVCLTESHSPRKLCSLGLAVGGAGWWLSHPSEKICSSNWIISPGRDENEKSLKPPPSSTVDGRNPAPANRYSLLSPFSCYFLHPRWCIINCMGTQQNIFKRNTPFQKHALFL